MAVVQSSGRHLLEHRLAGRHCVATVVTDGGGGGDLTGALAVSHWEKERDTHTVCFTCFGPRVLCPTTKTVIGQRDSSISLILSNTAVTPTNHLLFDSDSRGQSKQTHWPVRRYLRTSAKAMNCTHALTTAKLPSAHKCYWRPQLHQCEDSPMVEEVVRSFTWQCTQVPHSKSKGRVQTNYQQNVKVVIFQENGPREYYLSDW